MKPIPILLVDDHIQVRTLVLARLNREPEFRVTALADSSASAITSALDTHPQIILIDPKLNDGKGMEAIRQLKTELPDAEIVVLTAYVDTASKIELGNLGVRFILSKGIESYKLIELLRQAARCADQTAAEVNSTSTGNPSDQLE